MIQRIVAVGDGDGGARQTAESLARALGASVEPVANEQADLLVIDSRADAPQGRVSLSSSASHLIETATCPVLVVPRGVTAVLRIRRARARSRLAANGVQRRPPATTSAWLGRRSSHAGSPDGVSARSAEQVASERRKEVERAAEEVADRPGPSPRLEAPVPAGARVWPHLAARYRGARVSSPEDHRHRARRLARAPPGRGSSRRGRGPRRAQGAPARARAEAPGLSPREGTGAAGDPAHRP